MDFGFLAFASCEIKRRNFATKSSCYCHPFDLLFLLFIDSFSETVTSSKVVARADQNHNTFLLYSPEKVRFEPGRTRFMTSMPPQDLPFEGNVPSLNHRFMVAAGSLEKVGTSANSPAANVPRTASKPIARLTVSRPSEKSTVIEIENLAALSNLSVNDHCHANPQESSLDDMGARVTLEASRIAHPLATPASLGPLEALESSSSSELFPSQIAKKVQTAHNGQLEWLSGDFQEEVKSQTQTSTRISRSGVQVIASSSLKTTQGVCIPICVDGPWMRLGKPGSIETTTANIEVVPLSRKRSLQPSYTNTKRDARSTRTKPPTEECGRCCGQNSVSFHQVVNVRSFRPEGASPDSLKPLPNPLSNLFRNKEGNAAVDTTSRLAATKSKCRCSCHGARSAHRIRSVRFGEVSVRSFDRTIGDNPAVAIGTPISLDWTFIQQDPMGIDDFEAIRNDRRKKDENPSITLRRLNLSYHQRRSILKFYGGLTEEEIDETEKEMNRIRRQRNVTALVSNFWRVEDAMHTIGRRVKRIARGTTGKKG